MAIIRMSKVKAILNKLKGLSAKLLNKKSFVIIAIIIVLIIVVLANNRNNQFDGQVQGGIDYSNAGKNMSFNIGINSDSSNNSYADSGNVPENTGNSVSFDGGTSSKDNSGKVNFGDKIVYTGEIFIETKSVEEVYGKVKKLIDDNGGYITRLYSKEGLVDVEARVPSERFNSVTNIEELGDGLEISKNITSEDMSLHYSDEQAELESLRVQEQRILEYITKASNISELMELEDKLQSVRDDIACAEEELRMIDSYVSLSEVSFTIESSKTPNKLVELSFKEKLVEQLEQTGDDIVDMLTNLVLDTINFTPTLILYTIIAAVLFGILGIVKLIIKRKKNKKKTN